MVDGNRLLTNVIYRATVITSEKSKQSVGSSGLSFKIRYTRHKFSFNYNKYRLKTTLSKHIWELKDRHKDFSINLFPDVRKYFLPLNPILLSNSLLNKRINLI